MKHKHRRPRSKRRDRRPFLHSFIRRESTDWSWLYRVAAASRAIAAMRGEP